MLKVLIAITAIQAVLWLVNVSFAAVATVRSLRFKKALTCEDCEKRTSIYMLHDECWHALATRNEKEARILCLRCAQKRWGKPFEETDFSPAPCNDALKLVFERFRSVPTPLRDPPIKFQDLYSVLRPVSESPGDQKKPEENTIP